MLYWYDNSSVLSCLTTFFFSADLKQHKHLFSFCLSGFTRMDSEPWKIDNWSVQKEHCCCRFSPLMTALNIKNKFWHQISTQYNTDAVKLLLHNCMFGFFFQTHFWSEPFRRVLGTKLAQAKSGATILDDTFDYNITKASKNKTQFLLSFWGLYLGK